MPSCPACQKEINATANSCRSCGIPINDQSEPTRLFSELPTPSNSPSAKSRTISGSSSFDSIHNARFVPGTILAERYRIVGLLGRGMGEVYRTDDLKLGQPVALKFLPEVLSTDGAALARFHREVRVSRQVSHRNICRVYDIGEVDALRRRWPRRIISWNRLLSEGFRDPLVGRDILIGCAAGVLMILNTELWHLASHSLGKAPEIPSQVAPESLLGFRGIAIFFAGQIVNSLLFAAVYGFLLLLLSTVLREEWLTIAIFWLGFVVLQGLASGHPRLGLVSAAINAAMTLFILIRWFSYFRRHSVLRFLTGILSTHFRPVRLVSGHRLFWVGNVSGTGDLRFLSVTSRSTIIWRQAVSGLAG